MSAVVTERLDASPFELERELQALAARGLSWERLRPEVLASFRTALAEGRLALRREFETRLAGMAAARGLALLMDRLVRTLHEFTTTKVFPRGSPTAAERLSVVAVGGYGRGELAPFSDIDLLFILPYKSIPYTEQVVEWMLYILWDLGLKVGHATRSIDECMRQAKADVTIRTALLEARHVAGEAGLFLEFKKRFAREVIAGTGLAFVSAKLDERNQRHQRMGDSRYVVEPNIKEGKGGLRDLHTLFWIAKYLYRIEDTRELVGLGFLTGEEYQAFAKAEDFLWTLRTALHWLTGRAEERLTFDVQPEIARRMGYTDHAGSQRVERLMKHYYLVAKDVGDLTRIFCAALEAEHKRPSRFSLAALLRRRRDIEGFGLEGDRLTVANEEVFKEDPVKLLGLFHAAQQHDLDIHPRALRAVRRSLRLVDHKLRANAEANRLFLEMLTSRHDPETTLRRLNEAGVFGRFITDFGRVVAQMQYDMYHMYTVDEHTIRAIGLLHGIEEGRHKEEHPLSTEIVHKVLSRRVLYLAVLLHDIAKGRGGDHSTLGAEVAHKLCPRLGLSPEETETVAWLVLNHLAMSRTAQKRDIGDAKTITDFAGLVQSPERLRLLLVLTVVDMRATGPKVFNNWKAALLRDLYFKAELVLTGGLAAHGDAARVKAVLAALRSALGEWSEEDFAQHVARGHAAYWLALDTDTLARHARIIREAEHNKAPVALDWRIDRQRAVTELTVYTADHAGLFAKIAGAIAVAGGNILDARIFTLANGMALDSFWVQDTAGNSLDRPDRLARLASIIERSLAGRLRPSEVAAAGRRMPHRTDVFQVPPRVLIDNKASATHTVLEVNGRDRPGLLYELTRALTELNLQISSAKISTYGERVVDVFYVKDVFGLKVEHEQKLKKIREHLAGVLAGSGGASSKENAPEQHTAPPGRTERPAELLLREARGEG
ncbi:MAG TPA: [protein-PII] uridylyltransferase [Alphaproteobacteria bacterium]|nr:[protein-PII] uridylyltransferase [Alphaproteobacteria bacterium]